MWCGIRIEEGGLADAECEVNYAESPRMMTLESFFLLINKKINNIGNRSLLID